MVCAPQGLGSSSRAVTADLLSVFVGPLERLGLTYMVTGGVASVIYGDPRFTRDVDLVLDLDPDRVAGLHAAFPEADFYVPGFCADFIPGNPAGTCDGIASAIEMAGFEADCVRESGDRGAGKRSRSDSFRRRRQG